MQKKRQRNRDRLNSLKFQPIKRVSKRFVLNFFLTSWRTIRIVIGQMKFSLKINYPKPLAIWQKCSWYTFRFWSELKLLRKFKQNRSTYELSQKRLLNGCHFILCELQILKCSIELYLSIIFTLGFYFYLNKAFWHFASLPIDVSTRVRDLVSLNVDVKFNISKLFLFIKTLTKCLI